MIISNPTYPNCPTRTGDTCTAVAALTGSGAITPTVCLLCRYQGGPFCGSSAEPVNEFTTAINNYRKPPLTILPKS